MSSASARGVRLQRYLAAAGVAARRKAEQLITAGRVTVNGAVVSTLGAKVDPDHDAVAVDGQAVAALDKFYVLMNKPKACITAVTDDRGRPTVMDYLPNLPVPVKPVGRLDFYSEGVLLLTNDGELAARLLAPARHVPKTYHVKVHGEVALAALAALRKGVRLDDGTTTMPAEVAVLPGESKHTWLAITIHEGKQRQIHRMLEALGYRVDKLQRVAFANLTFHDLRVGDARELTQQELNELRDAVGLDHSTVSRGRWRARREDTDTARRARDKARAEAEADAIARDAGVARAGSEGAHARDERSGPRADRGRGSPPSGSRGDDRRPGSPRGSRRDRGYADDRRPSSPRGSRRDGYSDRGSRDDRRPAPRASRFGSDDRRAGSTRDSRGRPSVPSRGPRPDRRDPKSRERPTAASTRSRGQGRTFGKRATRR
jgi:23S rRNA pseudouridine2605 synthase